MAYISEGDTLHYLLNRIVLKPRFQISSALDVKLLHYLQRWSSGTFVFRRCSVRYFFFWLGRNLASLIFFVVFFGRFKRSPGTSSPCNAGTVSQAFQESLLPNPSQLISNSSFQYMTLGACGSVVVEGLCYKLGGRGFKTQ
jgi:hypothetical protein